MKARNNPFSTKRLHAIHFKMDTWGPFLERLEENKFRGAIVGPHGSGKTTLIIELQALLQKKGKKCFRIQLSEECKSFPILKTLRSLDRETMLFVDGAEQLNFFRWKVLKLLSRFFSGCIITSHEEGLLPTIYRCETSLPLLEEIFDELAEDRELKQQAPALFSKHHGNIRDCLREYYDICARR